VVSFVLVTSNPGKLAEARRILAREGVTPALEGVEVELPEIQSLDLQEVLAAKGREAWRRAGGRAGGRPLVVEETGLSLAVLGGFPGPLVRWMLEAVGAEGIARTARALGDDRAEARCALLWLDGERTVVGEGVAPGRLVLPPRGEGGFGWDPVFVPEGEERTYGELPAEVKDRIGHRGLAWRDLLEKLRRGGT
jgi:XTP/dITP diphosphohydrolase